MTPQSFSAWIEPLYISQIRGKAIVIDSQSQFIVNWIEENYRDPLEAAIVEVRGRGVRVKLVCTEEAERDKGGPDETSDSCVQDSTRAEGPP